MKKVLDNAGVAALQNEFFQLTLTEQQFRISQMRTNFLHFMLTYFDLHSNQVDQISNMPDSFTNMLVNGITTCWENGKPINFHKETLAQDDKKGVKDVIVSDPNALTSTFTDNSNTVTILPFYVHIRYR